MDSIITSKCLINLIDVSLILAQCQIKFKVIKVLNKITPIALYYTLFF